MKVKGQLAPQALEDIPTTLIVLVASMVIIMLLFNIYSSHLDESQAIDMYHAGEVLSKVLCNRVFNYGESGWLDAEKLNRLNKQDLSNITGFIEYGFNAYIKDTSWQFGENVPIDRAVLTNSRAVTIYNGTLSDSELIVKIWKKY
jgi:hypothetical protein